jgi:hypothetical protein
MAKGKGGKPAPAKAAPAKDAKPLSGKANGERPRTGASQAEIKDLETKKKLAMMGVDDEPKEWDFTHYNKVVSEMQSGSTSVGSVLSAMIFHIEEENKIDPIIAADR